MDIAQFLDMRDTKRKVLIADNVKNANRLVRKSRKALFNTDIKTLREIATGRIILEYARLEKVKEVQVLSDNACTHILYGILKDNRPNFLPEESLDINTAAEFLNVINKIRNGKPTQAYFKENEGRVGEIKNIIKLYENYLKENELFDKALLLECAKKLEYDPNISYYALENKYSTEIEKSYIDKLTKGKEQVTFLKHDLPENISFTTAYGIENEVVAVADNIAEQKDKKLGEFALYYMGEEYDSIIQGVFESKGIPCVISSGVSGLNINIIGLMTDILAWAKDSFLYSSLKSVMSSPVLCLDSKKGGSPYYQYISFLDKGLIYGIDNYAPWLDKKEKEAKEYTSNNKTQGEIEEERERKLAFINLMRGLLAIFENTEDILQIYKGLFEFVRKNTNNRYFEEKKALYSKFYSVGRELKYYGKGSFKEYIDTLLTFLGNIKIKSSERTDSVLAVRLSALEVLERKHNFFIGLSAEQFNSKIVESPVLYDDEIEKYLGDENLKSSKVNDVKRSIVLDTLKTADEDSKIFVSSITYDTTELKQATPSSLYMELLGNGALPEEPYTYKALPEESVNVTPTVWDSFPEAKNVGKIDRDPGKIGNMSATDLGNLLNCPQGYYLNKIVGIQNEEFTERNVAQWLPANYKGTYCHAVLEEYINTVIIEGKETTFNEAVYGKIFKEVFDKADEEIFCDSETVRETEKRDIDRQLKKYIISMHEDFNTSGFTPIACEAKFNNATWDMEEEGIKLNFHGIIDRIDKNAEGKYRIIDYKSGTFKSDGKDTYKQHIVYPLARETRDGNIKLDNIDSFSYEYIFSEKSKVKTGEELKTFTEEEKSILKNALNKGDYTFSQEAISQNEYKNCTYCNFKDICTLRMGGE
ncbi:MAG: PD-(D/E)XK nuclease family protein [Firmicutes bacterium]|nr:PD-(D/E)XK nuclease family protein [Bacillota bacterium]